MQLYLIIIRYNKKPTAYNSAPEIMLCITMVYNFYFDKAFTVYNKAFTVYNKAFTVYNKAFTAFSSVKPCICRASTFLKNYKIY